jgi:hypothetical protein
VYPTFWEERWSGEVRESYLQRVIEASAECARCPVLEACDELRRLIDPADPEIRGIVAGELLDTTEQGEWVKEQLRERNAA